MSLVTPTTKDINDVIIAQLEAAFAQTIPLLPKAFLRVLAKVLGGVIVVLYKYGGYMFLQIFVESASLSETEINGETMSPLKAWGRLIGIDDPAPATYAEVMIDIIVENQVGTLAANTQLINSGNGVTYLTLNAVALTAATVSATIRAASDQSGGGGAGAIGNLDVGEIVSFANPIPNVSRNATVAVQIVTGADGETADAYKQRIIDKFQKRPEGGAYSDYEIWGEEPSGIVNVYPYTSDCPGQVDAYVEATPESSGDPDGIPTTAQLEEVLASIELDDAGLATRRPAGALVNTFPISRNEYDIYIYGLTVDDEVTVQADITTGLTEYFLDRAPYLVGLTIPPRKDRITRTAVGGAVEDIVSAYGGVFSSVIVKRSGSTIDVEALGIGEKAKLGTVYFI